MAAVKASTCINVFMRRRTSTHTRTLSLVKAFCMSAPQRKMQRQERGAGWKMRGKQSEFTIQLGVEVLRARDQPATFVCAALCWAVLLLMSLPHSCRCIASMPQSGICHIGMCTMEITMQSLTNNHLSKARNYCISSQVHFRTHTKPKCRRASHEPRAKTKVESRNEASSKRERESPSPPSPVQHNIKQSSSVARCRFQFRCRFYIAYICRGCCCCCCCWIGLDRVFLGRLARVLSLGWLLQLQSALTAEGLSGLRAREGREGDTKYISFLASTP